MQVAPTPCPSVTVYHPITGRPVGTVPADDHESVSKLRARAARDQKKLEYRLSYSIADMDPSE